jgi:hypothetical protein
MKILKELQKNVSKTNALLSEAISEFEENSDQFKVLNHCILTGNTMMTALKETIVVIEDQKLSAKKKLSVMELIKATETWCNETNSALGA